MLLNLYLYQDSAEKFQSGLGFQLICYTDRGAGTFDVTLLGIDEGVFAIKAMSGRFQAILQLVCVLVHSFTFLASLFLLS